MNQNEEMFLESNVVSIFALRLKKLGGAQFRFLFSKIWKNVYSSTLGHQKYYIFLVELKLESCRQDLKRTCLIFILWPN